MNEQPLIIDTTTTADTTQAQAVTLQPPPKKDPNPKPGTDCPPAVPEPATVALIAAAIVAILVTSYRRNRR